VTVVTVVAVGPRRWLGPFVASSLLERRKEAKPLLLLRLLEPPPPPTSVPLASVGACIASQSLSAFKATTGGYTNTRTDTATDGTATDGTATKVEEEEEEEEEDKEDKDEDGL
jgi:hypothetical protein